MTKQDTMPSLFGRVTAVFQEHADLRPLVSRLRELATELAFGRDPKEPEVENLLDDFFDQLLAHFAAEENEGYFGTFVDDHPELSVHVEHLMLEHEEMVDAVERLRAFGERSAGARDLGLDLLMLLDRFETHEKDENALMRKFLWMAPNPEKIRAKGGR